eukprot:525706-Hanusia_phi.AAC.1
MRWKRILSPHVKRNLQVSTHTRATSALCLSEAHKFSIVSEFPARILKKVILFLSLVVFSCFSNPNLAMARDEGEGQRAEQER